MDFGVTSSRAKKIKSAITIAWFWSVYGLELLT